MFSIGGLSWISVPDFIKSPYLLVAAVVEVAGIGVVNIVDVVVVVAVAVMLKFTSIILFLLSLSVDITSTFLSEDSVQG